MVKFGKIWLLALALVPTVALAHGPVTTQSQVVGDYDIEFEYSTLGSIFVGDYTLYDVYLLNPKTREPLDFSSVFIKFTKSDSSAVLSASLAESAFTPGYANLGSTLIDADNYTADISFFQNQKALVHTTFNFKVEPAPQSLVRTGPSAKQSPVLISISAIVLGLGIIGVAVYLLKKKS